ncbi:MAG TPA: sigma-70 family RNA polymerase sigma factor [Myxococcaceae bacterium]|jgi:RNA polymerase sigma-70 factor
MTTKQVPPLAATFLAHAKVRLAFVDAAALDHLLTQHWNSCQAQWPTVQVPAESFVKHLAERLPDVAPESPLEPLLQELSLGELYLACGCLQGSRAAIELFDRHYLAKLPAQLRNPNQSDALIEDVCQQVRMKLLLTTPESTPKIGDYRGKGRLMTWVRVTASRMAIKLQTGDKLAPPDDPDKLFGSMPSGELDGELALIKRRYQKEFREATLQAFSTLSDEMRHLLRLYFVDRLSSYEIASLFRVDQATISRRLKKAREHVYDETRNKLQAQLGLSPQDFKSFLAVVNSQLNLSISQLLGEEDGAPRAPPDR